MSLDLTIAIPTFDRHAVLLQNLELLIPQIEGRCRLLVLDNHSQVPVLETLEPLRRTGVKIVPMQALEQPSTFETEQGGYSVPVIEVYRNAANIGAAANTLRAFEVARTPWLWVLGDDDFVVPDAVQKVTDAIATYGDSAFINFCSSGLRHPWLKRTRGRLEFLEEVDHFGRILSISCSVFQRERLLPFLRLGYHYAYSYASHLAALLASMDADTVAVFSNEEVIGPMAVGTDRAQSYSNVTFLLGVGCLFELLKTPAERAALARGFERLVRPESLAATLLGSAVREQDPEQARWLYDRIVLGLWGSGRSRGRSFRARLYRSGFRFPRLSLSLAETALKLLKTINVVKPDREILVVDRYQRM